MHASTALLAIALASPRAARWDHWAFVAPVRPDPPPVKRAGWARNAIDLFVLERLGREGLEPSPEADRITLLRRLSLDLTGLPPSIAEVDAFLAAPPARAPAAPAARPGSLASALQDPLAPRAPHHAPRAKHVIFLFMAGAPSHLELFDHRRLTFRFQGRDFRLTDVHGSLVEKLLA